MSASSTLRIVGAGCGEEGIVGDDGHAEGLGALGELGADAAHAEDGEALAVEFDALKGLAVPLSRRRASRRGPGPMLRASAEHQGEGVLGGGNRVAARRVHHDHAVVGGGGAVDVVDADAGAADGFEVLRRGENFGGDLGFGADDEAVVVADDLEKFVRLEAGIDIDGDSGGAARASTPFSEMGSETSTR